MQPEDQVRYTNLAADHMALNRLDEAEALFKQAEEHKLESEYLPVMHYVFGVRERRFVADDALRLGRRRQAGSR